VEPVNRRAASLRNSSRIARQSAALAILDQAEVRNAVKEFLKVPITELDGFENLRKEIYPHIHPAKISASQ
jgi:hypothetical protein